MTFSLANLFAGVTAEGPESESEAHARFQALRRNIMCIMLVVSISPLCLMALINHYESQRAIQGEVIAPLNVLVNETRHAFELFLAERTAAVSFVASAYPFPQLANQKSLESVFQVMRKEYGGFVDLGLIDAQGVQTSYVGPFQLEGKDYSGQDWFKEVSARGKYVSDVFLGYRSFPHFVIAVRHETDAGQSWILRTTIDTNMFDSLIRSMSLSQASDAFVINDEGVLQTNSKFYGDAMEKLPFPAPNAAFEPSTVETVDNLGREVLVTTAVIPGANFILALVKPRSVVLHSWYTLKSEMFYVFMVSLITIVAVVYTLTVRLVRRIELADMRREAALHSMEHANKLASIGRLAAGVAHEINNPLAIINEKAGLMEDLVLARGDMPFHDKFLELTRGIEASVDRCSVITHRLLGFARRMDLNVEETDINEMLREVLSFMEKEAMHRHVELKTDLAGDLTRIVSDRGQLQQVFLNILNNALNAVKNGGLISVSSSQVGPKVVAVSIEDNGCGMSEQTKRRIFEPFFSTKKDQGTGLGLSITYGIVQKLGGSIEVASEIGAGSRFTVRLPATYPKHPGE